MSNYMRIGLISTVAFAIVWIITLAVKPTVNPALAAEAAAAEAQKAPAEAEKAATVPPVEGEGTCALKRKKKAKTFAEFLMDLLPILGLLVIIGIVVLRLPKVDLGHSKEFRRRRIRNWVPLGLTYAFLYMGRYNLNQATTSFEEAGLMTTADFSIIFAVGTVTYGFSFIINGPLTDRIGGKKAIMIGAAGAALMNLLMGVITASGTENPTGLFVPLYALNMYFQSFGAVAIVKVNAPWFHVRERGVIGGLFGVLISLGVYFAFDWSRIIVEAFPGATEMVFFIPTGILVLFFGLVTFMVADSPGKAGFEDFNTGDATSGEDDKRLPAVQVFKMMLKNPVIMTIAAIEFCSGFLRQAIMQYFPKYSKATMTEVHGDGGSDWVLSNWGVLLCAAGITGGMVAGVISDHVYGSRRGPVAALLYAAMLICGPILFFMLGHPLVGWLGVIMSLAVIGVHGMLSGTASMDFGGAKNAGVAVGIIDGFVYLGTGTMSALYFAILPNAKHGFECPVGYSPVGVTEANSAEAWWTWPVSMIPLALIGTLLALKLWHAKPAGKGGGGH